MSRFKLAPIRVLALAALAFITSASYAISVDKTALEIDLAAVVKKGSASVVVNNDKDTPVFVSSAVKGWKILPDGKFELSDTPDIKLTPSIANLPSNGSATFQIKYVGDKDRPVQSGYRLTLKENPRLNLDDAKESLTARLMEATTMSVPTFVTPKAELSEPFENVSIKWREAGVSPQGRPRVRLDLHNAGERHVMAQELKLGDTVVKTLGQYLLPGDKVSLEVETDERLPQEARLEMMLRYLAQTKTVEVSRE